MKKLTEFTKQTQQIDEATTRGKATITVVDKEPTSMEGTIVHKTDGFMPNIEVGLKWNPDKQNGNLVLMMDMTKGSFEDKRYFKKFIKESTDILEQLDDLESALMVGRVKQAEKVLKMLGARVEIK